MEITIDNYQTRLQEQCPDGNVSLRRLAQHDYPLAAFITNNITLIDTARHTFTDALGSTEIGEIGTGLCNKLIGITGRVTRTSSIMPEMVSAEYGCKMCGSTVVLEGRAYACPNRLCGNRRKFRVRPVRFRDVQTVTVQECVVEGSCLPRSVGVRVYDSLIEAVRPGQVVTINGYLVIDSDTKGESAAHALVFRGISVDTVAPSVIDLSHTLSTVQGVSNLYHVLAESLFPSIYGHGNIKKAILLTLVGGSSTKRKSLNVLLVGDPGTAKSQFLKQISESSTLGSIIYTTGKTSSGVGLTAAVVKTVENESLIEAGALVLGDRGICCIDEFDKLSVEDKTALHEAMEQQTITINKCGIHITLNARTSIIAAANPKSGRYDKRQTLRSNVNLSETIMSRFDLFYVIVDEVHADNDRRIARRVINNHLNVYVNDDNNNDSVNNTINNNIILNKQQILLYLNHIKSLSPKMNKETKDLIISKYKKLRLKNTINTNNYKISIRTLESLIRISESIAKIYQTDVLPEYVEEGYKLITNSLVEIKFKDIKINNKNIKRNKVEKILNNFIFVLKTNERLSKDDLVLYYIESIINMINNENELNEERRDAEEVLEYLISKEGVLYENEGYVYVHPDYDV